MHFGMPTLVEIPDTEESAKLCRRLGLQFMEINMSFPQYQPENMDIEKLRAIKEKYGIYFTVHIDESLDPCSVNPGISRVYCETMLRTIEIAKALDIPVLNMHLLRGIYVTLPERRTYVYAENRDFYLAKMREFRDMVTDTVGDSGIKVCIENTDGYDLPFLSEAVDLLLESPVFGLSIDVGHDHAINNIDLPFILERRDRLCHMHLHDAKGTSVHLALGDGELDKDRFIRLAEESSSRILLETKTIEALKKSVLWINHWRNRNSAPDELWDVYDAECRKTGAVHLRKDPLGEGEYHLCVHVWMKNSRGEYLLTRRSERKSYAGMWEATGGSVAAGEDSLTSALREVKEETGLTLDAEKGRILFTYGGDHFFCDVWLFEQDFDLGDVVLQEEETCGVMYADRAKIEELMAEDRLAPFGYMDRIFAEE